MWHPFPQLHSKNGTGLWQHVTGKKAKTFFDIQKLKKPSQQRVVCICSQFLSPQHKTKHRFNRLLPACKMYKTVNSVALECFYFYFIMHSILIKVETCIKKSISTVSCSLILNCPPPLVSCFEQEPTDILIIHTPNNPTNLTLPWVFTLSVLFKHVLMFVWSSFKEFCNYVLSSTITFSLL